MYDTLLIDNDSAFAEDLIGRLQLRNVRVEWVRSTTEAVRKLGNHKSQYELVILNVSDASQPWLRLLHALQEASSLSGNGVGPLFLCVSTVKRDVLFELQIEQIGARLVYER